MTRALTVTAIVAAITVKDAWRQDWVLRVAYDRLRP